MTAYLDTNIIVGLEDGDFTLEEIKNLFPSNKVRFFYSSAHIFEVENFTGNSKISKNELLIQRFNSIRNISKNNYLFSDTKTNRITHIIEDPKTVYDTITLHPTGIDSIKGFMNVVSNTQKQEYRDQVGIEILKLNNYSSSEIIEHLNTKLSNVEPKLSLLEMVEKSISLHPGGKTMGIHNRIAAIFEFLDMLGYWKDRETLNSNYARLWDSLHSYFASYCDYFVSNDKKTRQKTEVVFNIYDIKTKIISSLKS